MADYLKILRLDYLDYSQRRIADSARCSRHTIRKVLEVASKANIHWPLVLVPPYFVFCSISFRCGGLSIERNQKPLTPENTLAVTHHDKQKQVEVKRSSRANPHEIRLFSGCPYYFTLPEDSADYTLAKKFWYPTEKGRTFCMDMHHIVSSKCTTKCCEKGRAYRCKSP